jgi:Rieske Fe-S protein
MPKDDPQKPILIISRRQFLLMTAGMGAIAGCQTGDDAGKLASPVAGRVVNAGPAIRYAEDGVYSGFREDGFFVVRKGEKLLAFSAICTHKKCKLAAESDHSFYCKCHGSTFDPDGRVTNGPAKRDLPFFQASVDVQGQLLVTVPGK